MQYCGSADNCFPLGGFVVLVSKKWPGRVIVRTSLSDELYFFQWPKSGPGSSRVEPRQYNWQSCSQTRSTKFGYKNEFDLKSVGCALEYGLLVTLQNMFDVSPIRCF